MATIRDGAVKETQRLVVIERAHFGHEPGEQIEQAIGLGGEGLERAAPVARPTLVRALDERAPGAVGRIGGGQEGERQVIAAFEMGSLRLEGGAALGIDEPARRIGKDAVGIARRSAPFGFEEQSPPAAEAPQGIVRPRTGRDQLGLGRAFEIGAAEGKYAQEAPVLVEHDSRRHQRCPWQVIGKPLGTVAIFLEVQHAKYPFWRMWRSSTGAKSGSRRAAMTATLWPTAHRSSPASHCWRPRPTAAASVPLTIASPRGAPPSSNGEPSELWIGTSKPSM